MTTTRRDTGHVLALAMAPATLIMAVLPFVDSDPDAGPPVAITALTVFAAVAIAGGGYASWKSGSAVGGRVAAAFLALTVGTSLPAALFIDTVPTWQRVFIGAYALGTVAAIVLMFSRSSSRQAAATR